MDSRNRFVALAVLAALPAVASAQQSSADDDRAIQEIIVTAQKREARCRTCRSPSPR